MVVIDSVGDGNMLCWLGVYMFRPRINWVIQGDPIYHYDSIYLHVIYVLCMK